jgi:hypothetical protein
MRPVNRLQTIGRYVTICDAGHRGAGGAAMPGGRRGAYKHPPTHDRQYGGERGQEVGEPRRASDVGADDPVDRGHGPPGPSGRVLVGGCGYGGHP